MERRRLGRLEHLSSVLIFGGAALADVAQHVSDASISLALSAGINHFDTAADYGDSELRLRPWMPKIRNDIFLASKTGDRDAVSAYASICRSLDRLGVERLDLIQLHAVGTRRELDLVTASGGALEGALRAKAEGLVGAIGITGHGMQAPSIHREALRRFDFDTVLTPWNYRLSLEGPYGRDFAALCEATQEQDVGLLLIKAIARNLWRSEEEATRTTWYEPLEDQPAVNAAVAFALGATAATGIATPGDVDLLPLVIAAERARTGMSSDDIRKTLATVPEMEPPFVPVPGRAFPDWIEPPDD